MFWWTFTLFLYSAYCTEKENVKHINVTSDALTAKSENEGVQLSTLSHIEKTPLFHPPLHDKTP